jgi:hypothetical protein
MSQKMDSLTDGKLAAASHYAAPMLPKERDNAKAFTGKKSGVATKEPDPSLVRFRRCNARGGDAAKQCRGWPKIIHETSRRQTRPILRYRPATDRNFKVNCKVTLWRKRLCGRVGSLSCRFKSSVEILGAPYLQRLNPRPQGMRGSKVIYSHKCGVH